MARNWGIGLCASMLLSLPGCGESGEVGPAGEPGAAATCTVKDNGDGTKTLACSDGTEVTLEDGAHGDEGPAGSPGESGAGCTIEDNGDGTRTVRCEDGTTATIADGVSGAPGTDGVAGSSCTTQSNGDGTQTIRCSDGTSAVVSDGADGVTGAARIRSFHGSELLMSSGEYAQGKSMVNATISSASADAAGRVSVLFHVENAAGAPVLTLTGINANIAKLVPASGTRSSSSWVPYLYRTQTVSGSARGDWPKPDGTSAEQGSRENGGTLSNLGGGDYSYVFAADLSQLSALGGPISYDRSLTHRVSIMMGGHTGPTADASFDFVPDGSSAPSTREIVRTATCKNCHGDEFHGHGGDRLSVENCATCHVPDTTDPHGGESLDLKVMVHKIHAGGDLPSIAGADRKVWDDPATLADEAADNGHYAIWGNGNTKHEWWKAGFPAVHGNCNKCHDGSGADSDNWRTHPSRAACGSCHDDVNFATGENHGPLQLAIVDDNACHFCHGAAPGPGPQGGRDISIPTVHNFSVADPRNVPEFDAALSVATPSGRNYFIKGEQPVITLVLTDKATGQAVDHTTLLEDATAEGCLETGCPARDGALRTASLFVHGPRARRNPVLTTSARAVVRSTGAGPFDLSGGGATLVLSVDQGRSLVSYDASGADSLIPGTITVPVSSGAFAAPAAATSAEVVTWLNANAAFAARAIASLEAGRVAIRSRNLGPVFALQLAPSAVTTALFGGDVTVHLPGTSNNIARRTNPANNDPKVQWFTDRIEYTLDPVDDLAPGTYIVSLELADRGRVSDTNYKTPTVAKLAFQVKTATEELPIASNCDSCHQAENGLGLVFDPARHNKIFDDSAIDQCGACHDYQSSTVAGGSWGGAKPISKRVHAVHFGSSLTYPVTTVDHADTVAGRAWDITFPQDVRNCQTCHPQGETSGSWADNPSRLACSGCHDGDAASAHLKLQTYDPTPSDPFSGDEQETCATCH